MADFASLTSTISIVLGVLTYFLTMMLEKAKALIAEPVPAAAQKNARENLRKRLLVLLLTATLPLLVFFGLLFYLCLPTTVSIRQTSSFQLWNFDLIKTLFVFLHGGVSACLIITGVVGILLMRKLQRCLSN